MAQRLRADLAARDVSAQPQRGPRARRPPVRRARLEHPGRPTSAGDDAPEGPAVPILRIFDRDKAVEFYVDYLGFTLDWEHGGTPTTPRSTRRSAAVARVLHLSEHHGDASPGGAALIPVADVDGPARRAPRAALRLRPARRARRGLGPGDGRHRPVPQPDRLPPAGGADDVEPRPSEAAGPIELDVLPRRARPSTPSTRSPGTIDELVAPGATRPKGWSGSSIEPARRWARDSCTWPTGRRTAGATVLSGTSRCTTRRPSRSPRTPSTPAARRLVRAAATAAAGCASPTAAGPPGNVAGRARFNEWQHPARPVRRGRRGAAGARRPRARDRAVAPTSVDAMSADVEVRDNPGAAAVRGVRRRQARRLLGVRADRRRDHDHCTPRSTTPSRGRASGRRWCGRCST